MSTLKLFTAVLLVLAHQAASAIEFKVNSFTSSSVTFTLSGNMPATNPGTLRDGPVEIDLLYTGNLWAGRDSVGINSLSATPLVGGGELDDGFSGGFRDTAYDYSWLHFTNDLTGLAGTGTPVTLTFEGESLLNANGTATIDLYWGNLAEGPDASGRGNLFLASVNIVDGRIVGAADPVPNDPGTSVPEPASLALFGASAAALALARRRKTQRA